MAFARLFDHNDSRSITEKLLADPDFRTADTDARFAKLFTALSSRAAVLYTFDQARKAWSSVGNENGSTFVHII